MNFVNLYIMPSAIAYLLGSISFSIIVSWVYSGGHDIRKHGSGNAGGTNVLRIMGPAPGIIAIILDILKCVAAVLIAKFFLPGNSNEIAMSLAGFFCVLGHMFPAFFGFKGGKGIACATGMLMVLNIQIFVICAIIFFIVLFATKYVSLSSMIGIAAFPIAAYFYARQDKITVTLIALAIALLVIYMHRTNIKRLIDGTETKFSLKKKSR